MEVLITETQKKLLETYIKENDDEITYYEFQSAVKDFILELLVNAASPKLPDFFSKKGVDKGELLKKMVDLSIVKEKGKIDDKTGKGMMVMSYSVPRKNFRSNILKLFGEMFQFDEQERLNEDGEGACAGDVGGAFAGGDGGSSDAAGDSSVNNAKSAQGSGQFITPLTKKVMRRTYAFQ